MFTPGKNNKSKVNERIQTNPDVQLELIIMILTNKRMINIKPNKIQGRRKIIAKISVSPSIN